MNELNLTKEADITTEMNTRYSNGVLERGGTFKHRLYNFRIKFDKYPIYYVLLKVLIGFITLVLPFLFFFNSMFQSFADFSNSKFSTAAIPLIISTSIILGYLLFLIIFKLLKVCKTM